MENKRNKLANLSFITSVAIDELMDSICSVLWLSRHISELSGVKKKWNKQFLNCLLHPFYLLILQFSSTNDFNPKLTYVKT